MRSEGYCSLCVCLLSHISPLERLFVLKTLSRTQRATKVKNICGVFSETAPLQRSSTPSVDGHTYSRPFFLLKARMRIIVWPRPALCFPVPAYNYVSAAARLFAFLPRLAAQRNGGKRMCQSGLPADAASLALLTGIHRPWTRIPSNSIAT